MPHAARLTPHASRLTPHASRLTPHASRRTPHASRLTPHSHSHSTATRAGALGFEDIATIPKPGQQGLSQVAFSPDGRHVTYLGGDPTSLTRQLFAFDCETGATRTVLGGGVVRQHARRPWQPP
eukprot:scaffold54834_cov57-Phaeocystis_antarctica.AAC.1